MNHRSEYGAWRRLGPILLLALGWVGGAAAGTTVARPNVLYLFTDDQSARTLGSYAEAADAYRWVNTPNLDQLARDGVRFTTAYTGAKCVPARGNALTGRLQTGYTKQTPYWTTALRAHGYFTGMIGKWHWNVPRHGVAWDWSVVWPHHEGNTGDDEGSDYYWNQQVSLHGGPRVPLGGYSTDRYTDYTIEFLRGRAAERDRPWFFWLCFAGVHGPYTPADRHLRDYADAPTVPTPADIFGPRPDKPESLVHFSRWTRGPGGEPVRQGRTLDSWVKQYNQAVRSIDEGVGRILQTLRETGQLENTIVIFTSDQGFAWGQHGFRDKLAPYDANLLAPLIVSSPARFPRGAICREPVNGVDIIATIHALTGLSGTPTDGRNFSALLSDPQRRDWTSAPLLQTYTGNLYGDEAVTAALRRARETGDWSPLIAERATGTRAWLMLREGRHKYVRYLYDGYIEELYDLAADPHELTNLAVRREHHPLLATLRKKLVAGFAARGATFLDLLPAPRVLDAPPAVVEAPAAAVKSSREKSRRKG